MFTQVALAVLFISQTQSAPSLDAKVASVLPKAEEVRWQRIPWQPNLMQGRHDAQSLNKPLLIWIMDGNVLGCT